MFKTCHLYRIAGGLAAQRGDAEQRLQDAIFTPCWEYAPESLGWTPPRHQPHGAMIEAVGGHWILEHVREVKRVPGDVLRRAVDERVRAIEAAGERTVGRREKKEIREAVRDDLLAKAFATRSHTRVWIDPAACLLAIGTSSEARAVEIIAALCAAFEGLAPRRLTAAQDAAGSIATWLAGDQWPDDFEATNLLELRLPDMSQGTVRYANLAINRDDVRAQLAEGLRPRRIGLAFRERAEFVLGADLSIRALTLATQSVEPPAEDADEFDAEVALWCGEIGEPVPSLMAALGGEWQPDAAAEA